MTFWVLGISYKFMTWCMSSCCIFKERNLTPDWVQIAFRDHARWFIHAEVHNNSGKRLEEWGWHFLATKKDKQNEACPAYKGGTWLSLFGHSITLYVRATRAILNHAPIGEYREIFHPQEPTACVERWTSKHELISWQMPRVTKDRVTLSHPCLGDFIKFLTSNPTTFAFALHREPSWTPKSINDNVSSLPPHEEHQHALTGSHLLTSEYALAISLINSGLFLSVCWSGFIFIRLGPCSQ